MLRSVYYTNVGVCRVQVHIEQSDITLDEYKCMCMGGLEVWSLTHELLFRMICYILEGKSKVHQDNSLNRVKHVSY